MIATLTAPSKIDLDTPQIYVACLASYVSGHLHGRFIDATQDAENIHDEIQQMLSTSPIATDDEPCEEWAIHDYENFCSIRLDEYENIEHVSALAQTLQEHGEAFAKYFEHIGFDSVEEALTSFEDNYCGCFESIEDYARDYYEQTGELEIIEKAGLNSYYINWSAIARDWEYSGDISCLEESHNQIHVFYNH